MADTVKDLISGHLKKMGRNQSWLAKEMDVSPSTISYMLKSHPKTLKINDLERLCKALKISTEKLMKEYFAIMEGNNEK